jgi:hypothetical protein
MPGSHKRRREMYEQAASGDKVALEAIEKIRAADRNSKRLKRDDEKEYLSSADALTRANDRVLKSIKKYILNFKNGKSIFFSLESGRPCAPDRYSTYSLNDQTPTSKQDPDGTYALAFYNNNYGDYSSIGLCVMEGEQAINRIIMAKIISQSPDLCTAVRPDYSHPHETRSPSSCSGCPKCDNYRLWYLRFFEIKRAFMAEDNCLAQILTNHNTFYEYLDRKLPHKAGKLKGYFGYYRQMWLHATSNSPSPTFDMDQGRFIGIFVYVNKLTRMALPPTNFSNFKIDFVKKNSTTFSNHTNTNTNHVQNNNNNNNNTNNNNNLSQQHQVNDTFGTGSASQGAAQAARQAFQRRKNNNIHILTDTLW